MRSRVAENLSNCEDSKLVAKSDSKHGSSRLVTQIQHLDHMFYGNIAARAFHSSTQLQHTSNVRRYDQLCRSMGDVFHFLIENLHREIILGHIVAPGAPAA